MFTMTGLTSIVRLRLGFRRFLIVSALFAAILLSSQSFPKVRFSSRNDMASPIEPRPQQPLVSEHRAAPYCIHAIPSDAAPNNARPYNARSFCRTSVCIRPRGASVDTATIHIPTALFADQAVASCSNTDSTMRRLFQHPTLNCSALQSDVICAQGHYNFSRNDPYCPHVRPLGDFPEDVEVIKGTVIVVPVYKYLTNIFHYVQAIVTVVQIASTLASHAPPHLARSHEKKLTIVFRGKEPAKNGAWQKVLTQALIKHRLEPLGFQEVEVRATNEKLRHESISAPFCAEDAVLMGMRYDDTSWPFLQSDSRHVWPFPTTITTLQEAVAGSVTQVMNVSVGIESLAFRRAVYSATNQTTRIPLDAAGVPSRKSPHPSMVLDLPPKTVVYASRNGERDPKPGGSVVGSPRRLSDADDAWMTSMLRIETTRQNWSFTVAHTATAPFQDQVSLFREAGVTVGLHGANLVNTIFSVPFSALVEVSNHPLQCYIAGANSGLVYQAYMVTHIATAIESACPLDGLKELCETEPNWRRVKIDDEVDRKLLRRAVTTALEYINGLHVAFGHLGGIPVLFDDVGGEYHIDWTKKI